MNLPKAKNTDIIVQLSGNELLVYDLKTNKAYSLNEITALIYDHCDGKTSFADLKLKYRNLTDDIINFALDELKRENLIAGEHKSAFSGISRREVIKKIGLSSMIALPVITTIIAPTSAHAQSCLASGISCNLNNPGGCCSKVCLSNGGNPICSNACIAGGGSCNINDPAGCCSGTCLSNGGNPICGGLCTPNGGPCNLNDPGTCCSQICFNNGGNPICVIG